MTNKYSFMRTGLLWMVAMLLSVSSWAQTKTVTGTVTSMAEGEALPGVSIRIKSSGAGTVTNIDGQYSIEVPGSDAVLVFSYVGYTSEELAVGNQTMINIALAEDIETLGEVVVVGYGTQEKREVTGSIARVEGTSIADVPTPSFESALQGKAAGVQVIQGSGLAGSGAVIRIRGIASIGASGDPLYVVDGIPITSDPFLSGDRGAMNTNPLATINPNDIESVEILKDASAAGIYGSRGANGVILITTKRGKSGKPQINFSSQLGVSGPTIEPNMLNTAQLIAIRQEAWENDGNTGAVWLPGRSNSTDSPEVRATVLEEARQIDTDWWDLNTRTGFKQEYNLGVNYGKGDFRTFISGAYSDNESYLVGNAYNRKSLRANLDYTFNSAFSASFTGSYSQGINNRTEAAWSGGAGRAMSTAMPYWPVYYTQDQNDPNNPNNYYYPNSDYWQNSVLVQDNSKWKTTENRVLVGLGLNYKLTDRLSLNANGNLDYLDLSDDKYSAPINRARINDNGDLAPGFAELYTTYGTNYNVYGTATYDFDLGENQKLKLLGGTEYQYREYLSYRDNYEGEGITDLANELDNVEDFNILSEINNPTFIKFASYFGRLNYSFNDRYLVQASFRADGSSNFGPDNKYGYFPTIAGGWVISEEEFLKNSSTINFLKLKTSYGLTGNSNFPPNQWRSQFTVVNNGYGNNPYIYQNIAPNPDLQWEQARNWDAGFELGLFSNRITAEFSYYNRLTSDVLTSVSIPGFIGSNESLFDNIGEILNEGVEFSFTSRNIDKVFKWKTDFNIAHNYNEVVSLQGLASDAVGGGTNDTRIIVGQPVGTNFLVKYAGVDPETGNPLYFDLDGNLTTEWSESNRQSVGNVLPDFTGGITNTFNYKNWQLEALVIFVKGGDIYDSSSKRQLGVVSDWNMRSEIFDHWTPNNRDAKYPKLTMDPQNHGASSPWINTDLWLQDGSFARLRNLSLGYSLPREWASKIGASNASLKVSGFNLVTFSKLRIDPEIARDFSSVTDRNLSPNITYLTPPQEKSVNLTLNVTF